MNESEENIVTHSKKNLFQYIFCCCPSFVINNLKSLSKGEYDLGSPIPFKDNPSLFRKTLVLDLDKTLVYSSFRPFSVKGSDFTIKYRIRNNEHEFTSYILKRPGLDSFLNYIKEKFEVAIFTASLKEYADAVIDVIAPWIPSSHRFYRNHCKQFKGAFVKDLSKFNRPIESIFLIDDSFLALSMNRSNAIAISAWFGEANDKELDKMEKLILPQLETVNDVRSAIIKLI